jgi:hypothetical protein
VALDGKALRGMLSHESELQISVHLVALSEVKMGSVLAQRQGEEHHNEWSEVKAWLTPALVKGRVLTADAMFYAARHSRTPSWP